MKRITIVLLLGLLAFACDEVSPTAPQVEPLVSSPGNPVDPVRPSPCIPREQNECQD
jgi:hypothetical protein